jgi:type IV pilus assembly protein PilB
MSLAQPGENFRLYSSPGCNACHNTGYCGRHAIYEVLEVSHKIRRMIIEGSSDDAIKRQAIEEGMKTLLKSGLEQVFKGATTLDEIRRLIDMRTE